LQRICRIVMRKSNVKASPRTATVRVITPKTTARPAAWPVIEADRAVPGEAAHSRAYAVLKEAVLAGNFRPGDVLTLR
jgi:hypothetical protein